MKKINLCFYLSLLMLVNSCRTNVSIGPDILKLNENWLIQSADSIQNSGEKLSSVNYEPENWFNTDIPITVLAALAENEVYPDPYYGDNLKSIPGYREGRWLAMLEDSPFYPSWWYRKEFEIPAKMQGRKLALHLDGINYKANVWLNGTQIADSNQVIGMFRRFEFDIDQFVNAGEINVLAIEIISPGHLPDVFYRTKQLEATTGWDDHNPQPPDLNMGIWRDVYISSSGSVVIKHPYIVTDLDLPSLENASLTVSAQVVNKSSSEVEGELIGTIENIKFKKKVILEPNEAIWVKFTPEEFSQLKLEDPRLWWPHPYGKQELYKAHLEFKTKNKSSDQQEVNFGIREVSTYIDDEGWRGYMVNGKKILIRGGAWMTSDMLLNLSERRYEALVRYAREANLNMLRSEGFSIRETDEFYDICDKLGVMVTQQIFGRNLPDEALSIQNIEDMLLRIRNHPSLVHFLGHDETFPTENLDSAYRSLIARYTPERTYQPHSGAFDIENRFKTGGTRTGTLELWTYAYPSHYYTHKVDGAWGFAQSGGIGGIFAPYSSMQKMMPEDKIWPPYNETFSFHSVLQGIHYFDVVIKAMQKRYGEINDAKEFASTGMLLNYESSRGMFEAYGRNKYDALGITTWKYDAAWPAALTWQYVDWYLNVGGAYYGAKKACEPLHVQYAYDDESVYVINNYFEDFQNLVVEAKVLDLSMQQVFAETKTISVNENDKALAFQINVPEDISKTYFLSLKLKNEKDSIVSDNFYWLSTVKDIEGSKEEVPIFHEGRTWHVFSAEQKSYADFTALKNLPMVKVNMDYFMEIGEEENTAVVFLDNPSETIAFGIQLSLVESLDGEEILPAYWDDNYFSLLPGESRTIKVRFNPEDMKSRDVNIILEGSNLL
ncbi:MAG: hypothetical protein QNK30_15940 [Bacteroidales bacterium]|nr:hypothetical protein [Bacteroidales bacterium]